MADLCWTRLFPAATPNMRGDFQMVLDESTLDVILFGSRGTSPFPFQTWKWTGSNWVQESPTSTPAPAAGYTLFVQSLGWDGVNNKPLLVVHEHKVGGPDILRFFHYDWGTPTWTEIFPATVPASGTNVIGNASLFWIPTASLLGMYLHGGGVGHTWTWDGTDWTDTGLQVPTARNPPLTPGTEYGQNITNGNYVYDPTLDEVIYYGGNPDGVTNWLGTSDLDSSITAWTLIASASYANTQPGPRGTSRSSGRFMAYLDCVSEIALWGDTTDPDHAWLFETGSTWADQGILPGTPFGSSGCRLTTDRNGDILKFGGRRVVSPFDIDSGTYILSCCQPTRVQVMRWW